MGKVSVDIFQSGINVANKRSGVESSMVESMGCSSGGLGPVTSTFMAAHNQL